MGTAGTGSLTACSQVNLQVTSMKSFFTFLRSEPVVIGMKAGFLGAVIFLALHYLGGC